MLNCQAVNNNVPELEALIDTSQHDIVSGTGSWLDETIPPTEHLPTYRFNLFRNDRHSNGGGVFILVTTQIVCSPLVIPNNLQTCFREVDLLGCYKLIVSAFYRSPATGDGYFDSFDEITLLRITSHTNAHFWI